MFWPEEFCWLSPKRKALILLSIITTVYFVSSKYEDDISPKRFKSRFGTSLKCYFNLTLMCFEASWRIRKVLLHKWTWKLC
jgi:hypothetical protein